MLFALNATSDLCQVIDSLNVRPLPSCIKFKVRHKAAMVKMLLCTVMNMHGKT